MNVLFLRVSFGTSFLEFNIPFPSGVRSRDVCVAAVKNHVGGDEEVRVSCVYMGRARWLAKYRWQGQYNYR